MFTHMNICFMEDCACSYHEVDSIDVVCVSLLAWVDVSLLVQILQAPATAIAYMTCSNLMQDISQRSSTLMSTVLFLDMIPGATMRSDLLGFRGSSCTTLLR